MTGLPRRHFLGGAVAIVVPRRRVWAQEQTSTLQKLSQLLGQQQGGYIVSASGQSQQFNAEELLTKLANHPVMISFAYSGCTQTHTEMYKTIKALHQHDPRLLHLVLGIDDSFSLNDNTARYLYQDVIKAVGQSANEKTFLVNIPPEKVVETQKLFQQIQNSNRSALVNLMFLDSNGVSQGFKSTNRNSPEAIIKWGAWKGGQSR